MTTPPRPRPRLPCLLIAALSVSAALATGACSSDGDGGGNTGVDGFATDTPGGFANQDVSASTGIGPDGGISVDTGVDQGCAEPERNALCREDYDKANHGNVKIPWCGFNDNGKDYTCNNCPGGHNLVQGTWRFVDFETEDPNVPVDPSWATNWKENITFDGNTWLQHSQFVEDGVLQDAVLEGWYWCSDTAENAKGTIVFIVSNTEPEGALGYADGFVFSANLLLQGVNQLDINFYLDHGIDQGPNQDQLYCRVGTTIQTLAGDEAACVDPFE